jgi:hypothetical protein
LHSADEVLLAAAWRGLACEGVGDDVLEAALRLARRNGVQGHLARHYPDRLASEMAAVAGSSQRFRRNLADVATRLRGAGVEPILIKCDPADDFVYSNFDLVVGEQGWQPALDALKGWGVRQSSHPLEPDKLIVHPPEGPAAHLHRHVSWFGVTVVEAGALRAAATSSPQFDVLLPAPVDALRLLLAHAAFQNLAIDLSELRTERRLLDSGVDVAAVRSAAIEEGWGWAFDLTLTAVRCAIRAIDADVPPRLPVALPSLGSMLAGLRHAGQVARRRPAMALREVALRGPLVIAKTRRNLAM